MYNYVYEQENLHIYFKSAVSGQKIRKASKNCSSGCRSLNLFIVLMLACLEKIPVHNLLNLMWNSNLQQQKWHCVCIWMSVCMCVHVYRMRLRWGDKICDGCWCECVVGWIPSPSIPTSHHASLSLPFSFCLCMSFICLLLLSVWPLHLFNCILFVYLRAKHTDFRPSHSV